MKFNFGNRENLEMVVRLVRVLAKEDRHLKNLLHGNRKGGFDWALQNFLKSEDPKGVIIDTEDWNISSLDIYSSHPDINHVTEYWKNLEANDDTNRGYRNLKGQLALGCSQETAKPWLNAFIGISIKESKDQFVKGASMALYFMKEELGFLEVNKFLFTKDWAK